MLVIWLNYKKRLLLSCIHHFKSGVINNMDHMCISGNELKLRDLRCSNYPLNS